MTTSGRTETHMSETSQQQSRLWPPALETLTVRAEGATLFAEINSPSMSLLEPALVRDLASINELAEADDTVKVLVLKTGAWDFWIRTWTPSGPRTIVRNFRHWWAS